MFVDASAIVAILTRAPGADALADALETARSPITSPITVFEAALGLCRRRHATIAEALADVQAFLAIAGIRTVSITGKEAETALDAFARYGKGGGHPAQLTPAPASPTRSPGTTARRCSPRETASTKPTFALRRSHRNRGPAPIIDQPHAGHIRQPLLTAMTIPPTAESR